MCKSLTAYDVTFGKFGRGIILMTSLAKNFFLKKFGKSLLTY